MTQVGPHITPCTEPRAWRNLSAEVRASAERCFWCGIPLDGQRSIADHVIPVKQRPDLALDRENVRASCIGRSPCRGPRDRKSTRLNSSHDQISYAVFCLKKKNRQ